MATQQYRQGAAFENRVKDRFEEAGYYVLRSAGSKGVADLVAFDLMADRITHHPVPLMIQCKRGKNGLGVEAWNHFYAIADAAGCLAVVAQKTEGRTLEADLWELTGTRTPRGRHKPWMPWTLRATDTSSILTGETLARISGQVTYPETAPRTRIAGQVTYPDQWRGLQVRHLCECGHGLSAHIWSQPQVCMTCLCEQFKAW